MESPSHHKSPMRRRRRGKRFRFTKPKRENHDKYKTLASRLKTFKNWPKDHCKNPQELAEAGFFYPKRTASDWEIDSVRCFYCDVGFCGWKPEEKPWVEHARFYPKCAFLIAKKGQDFIAEVREQFKKSTTTPKYPKLETVVSRVKTFKNWPEDIEGPSPQKFAEAGFFYIGKQGSYNGVTTDEVRCFFCNIGVCDWSIEDEPWIEHAKNSPYCKYLITQKGEKFIDDIQATNKPGRADVLKNINTILNEEVRPRKKRKTVNTTERESEQLPSEELPAPAPSPPPELPSEELPAPSPSPQLPLEELPGPAPSPPPQLPSEELPALSPSPQLPFEELPASAPSPQLSIEELPAPAPSLVKSEQMTKSEPGQLPTEELLAPVSLDRISPGLTNNETNESQRAPKSEPLERGEKVNPGEMETGNELNQNSTRNEFPDDSSTSINQPSCSTTNTTTNNWEKVSEKVEFHYRQLEKFLFDPDCEHIAGYLQGTFENLIRLCEGTKRSVENTHV